MINYIFDAVIILLLLFYLINFINNRIKNSRYNVIFTAKLASNINPSVALSFFSIVISAFLLQYFQPLTEVTKQLLYLFTSVVALGYLLLRPKLLVTEEGIIDNFTLIKFSELQTIRFVVKGRRIVFAEKIVYRVSNRHELNYIYHYFMETKKLQVIDDQTESNNNAIEL